MGSENEIVFDYKNIPTVRDFSRSDQFIRGLMGPFGSAKSSGCVVDIIRRAHAQEPGADGIRRTRWAVIRNTYQQLRDTTIKTFHEWVPPALFGQWNKSEHTYYIKGFEGVEIEVMFRALDRPDQVGNLLSLELTGAWVNEAREVPWTIIQAIQGRVGRFPSKRGVGATWYGILMDTNPPDEDSWWYEFFEERNPDNAELFKQPGGRDEGAENIPNLPTGYYTNMVQSMDAPSVKVYVDGQYGFVQDGKPVYPEYNDMVHCQPCEALWGTELHRGWDFGLTPACVISQVTPSGKWLILDELIGGLDDNGIGIDAFGDRVLEFCSTKYAKYKWIDTGDPAGHQRSQTDEKTCFEILRGKGVTIEAGQQGETIRLESVRKPLLTMIKGEPRLIVSPRCKKLRKGFAGRYKYKRVLVSEERYRDTPDKNDYSHAHDALQYTATKLFSKEVINRKTKWKALEYDNRGIV